MIDKKLTDQLQEKYNKINQDLETHLEGMLYSKPINYWDYIQTDALLSLQTQRTLLPDEMVFIMYHQINELLFKMILWEIEQVAKKEDITATFFSEQHHLRELFILWKHIFPSRMWRQSRQVSFIFNLLTSVLKG